MGRSESKQAFQQSSSQSAQDQRNAQAALASTNKSVGDYTKNVNNFMRFGRQTFGANGEYMKDQNVLATTAAKAGSDKIGGDLALNAMRTGENTAGYAGTLAESQRQGSRDLTDQLARADANRLSQLTAVNQYGVDAAKFPAQVYGSLYGQGTSGASSEMGNASSAAKMPGFWDTFAPALAQGAGAVGAGFATHCWIAAAVYDGWLDPRTVLVREWLSTEFIRRPIGRLVMALYARHGRQVAEAVKRHAWLRRVFRPLFDSALRHAQEWKVNHAS